MKNPKKYIIGIDCGASKTEMIVLPIESLRKEIISKLSPIKKPPYPPFVKGGVLNYIPLQRNFPPINYNLLGEEKTVQNLSAIIQHEMKDYKSKNISIVIGISGARNKKDRDKIKNELIKKFKIKNICVLPDTEIALASIFDKNERNCGILIAGTGSVLYYRDRKGKINRVGGWGRFIGDEGSGYWIGREALRKLTKFFDGIKLETNLDKVIRKHLSIDRLNLIKKIYHENFDLSKITKYVFMNAAKGDKLSNEIIIQAAVHLANHFEVLGKTDMIHPWRIGLLGSLFTKEKLLEKYFRNIVKNKYPDIELIMPVNKPVWGAVKIGIEKFK